MSDHGGDCHDILNVTPVEVGRHSVTLGEPLLKDLAKREGDQNGGFHHSTPTVQLKSFGGLGASEERAGLLQMRNVEHHAVESDNADISRLVEDVDDGPGVRECFLRGRDDAVDDGGLIAEERGEGEWSVGEG